MFCDNSSINLGVIATPMPFKSYPFDLIWSVLNVKILIKASLVCSLQELQIPETADINISIFYTITQARAFDEISVHRL